ncbi:DUF6270 domain-containing protein [Brevibacterium sp. K11IcPPYGO002]|uniref:DUF6270 domain-containing protein n=1 Tax=Brevibacterium sp. K11IcPPYGO002 TaxID=3058837 RepID=UPI003D8158EF
MQSTTPATPDKTFYWQGLEEFLAVDALPDGIHRLRLSTSNGTALTLDLRIHLDQGAPMTVHFYGAQQFPRKNTDPIFGALPTSRDLGSSYVLIHDPTLSLSVDIGLAWYEGYKGFAAAPTIRTVLCHLAEISNAPRTVLWGGSAGGYAVLRHVGTIPNAVGFVWNPQTAITRYQPAPVRRYANLAFDSDDLARGAASTPGITVDLTTLPQMPWSKSSIVYLQEADDRHVSRHLAYLLADQFPEVSREVVRRDTLFGLITPNFYLHQSLWEPGHTRPPKSAMNAFLRRLLDMSLDLPEILSTLQQTSHDLIRASKSSFRGPVRFELDAPVKPVSSRIRTVQWGSRFGREVTAQMTDTAPALVTRSILGQSIITAFSVRKSPIPKTALDLAATANSEQRQYLLRDRRASAKAEFDGDSDVEVVVLDLFEEVRGTVNAGNGFIVTNHGFLRRSDGSDLTEHEFGSKRHRTLWKSRLERLNAISIENGVDLVLLHADAERLTIQDWEWLGIPEPTVEVLDRWSAMMDEVREQLPAATWIDAEVDAPLHDVATITGEKLAHVLTELKSLGRNGKKSDPEDSTGFEHQSTDSF